MSDYRRIYLQRIKQGHAKKATPSDRNSITIDGPNIVDESGSHLPKVPPKPEQPQLPVDDAFRKLRTNQA